MIKKLKGPESHQFCRPLPLNVRPDDAIHDWSLKQPLSKGGPRLEVSHREKLKSNKKKHEVLKICCQIFFSKVSCRYL